MKRLQLGDHVREYHLKQMKDLYDQPTGRVIGVLETEVGHKISPDDDWIYWVKEIADLDREILDLEKRREAIKEVEEEVVAQREHSLPALEFRLGKAESRIEELYGIVSRVFEEMECTQ